MNEFIQRYIELKKLKRIEKSLRTSVVKAQIKLGAAAHNLGYGLGEKGKK